jgi:hypothetical protein
VATSKRPIVDLYGSTWLGDPEGADFSIEIDDEFIGLYLPSGETRVPWDDIASMEIDIPTANWRLASLSHRVLATMDALESVTSNGVTTNTDMRYGDNDIAVRIVRRDGTEVSGWARKHQSLGYPKPEAEAAKAVLQGRLSPRS